MRKQSLQVVEYTELEARFLFHSLRIAKKRIEGEIMIVSHGTLIRLLLTCFLGKDINSNRIHFLVIENIGMRSLILDVSEDLERPRFDFQLLCCNCNIS
jgi:hypothetical protein